MNRIHTVSDKLLSHKRNNDNEYHLDSIFTLTVGTIQIYRFFTNLKNKDISHF